MELVDAALTEGGECGEVFAIEDDVFVCGKAVLEGVAGDDVFALGADGALGFGAIAAGDVGGRGAPPARVLSRPPTSGHEVQRERVLCPPDGRN